MSNIVVAELDRAFELRLPEIPKLDDSRYSELCSFYQTTPNLSHALDYIGFEYHNEEAKLTAMRGIKNMPVVGAYLDSVDRLYQQNQRHRTEMRELATIADDVYSALPIEGMTDDEKSFVANYAGDTKDAMVRAGLKPTARNKLLLLKSSKVQECKQILDALLFSSNFLSAAEALSLLADMARDDTLKPGERTTALKLLLQQQGELSGADDTKTAVCFLHNRNPQSCKQEFPTIAK